MESVEAKLSENPPLKTHKLLVAAQVFLRVAAVATALAAACRMATSKETVIVFGMPFDARYTYSSAFKFSVFANAFACGFTFLSLLFLSFFAHRGLTPSNYYVLFLHDLFMMSLVLAGVSAGTAIGLVGRNGNMHAGWLPICDRLNKFCHRVTTSLILSYIAMLCLLLLTIISATKSTQIQL